MLRRKVNKLLGSLLVVLFFLTFAQCSYNHLPIESPSEVVQKYTDAMKQYDMITMQKLMSSDANRTNSAAAGLIGDIVGGFTGFNFNMDNILTLAGPLSEFNRAMGFSGPFDHMTLLKIEAEEIDEDLNSATVV